MQLFVDMDGVLADFDGHHAALFGIRADKQRSNVDWARIRADEAFYLSLPPMADLPLLWEAIAPLRPIVLTGLPSAVPEAPERKRAWARRHLGAAVEVRCCRSKHKHRHAAPGDILIDDWERYRALWIGAGGRWITHASAADTLRQLRAMGAV